MALEPDGAPEMPKIDKLVHEPARLRIMTNLYVVEKADFMFLMRRTGLTFGNLSSHLSKLEAANYVVIEKRFVGKKPQTMVQLSRTGRKAFEDYSQKMRNMLSGIPID